MDFRRPFTITATMLSLLTLLVIFHLYLLGTGLRECTHYQSLLRERIARASLGTSVAAELRAELKEYLSNTTGQCGGLSGTYSAAVEMYLAVILSLLTGAASGGRP